jgi:TPR repeat protein
MLAMGDLYYYGARGLPQDHGQALQYYNQAASYGDASGMCGAANMYLKGEGMSTGSNVTRAIELYEQATKLDSIRAFNGLGYLYFYGQQVEQNETKAFEYFLHAASYENDGDSMFNVAFCLERGLGTPINLLKAVYYYNIAARKLGHFGSVQTMGFMYLEVS